MLQIACLPACWKFTVVLFAFVGLRALSGRVDGFWVLFYTRSVIEKKKKIGWVWG
jgi:hypothetical protein